MVCAMSAVEISVTQQGRLVIPAALRKQLGLAAGTRLIAHAENGRLVLEPRERLWNEIYKATASVPKEVDLAQELIDERRASAMDE